VLTRFSLFIRDMKQYSSAGILIEFQHEQTDGIPLGTAAKLCLRRQGLKLLLLLLLLLCVQERSVLGGGDTCGCQDEIASERKEHLNLTL
jgi:hypothetical protein